MDDDHRLLLEYKFFEPYFYAMDIPDWGTSLLHCLALGERAQVVLDTGHHAPGTNIEFIVMQLLRQNRLGAFDFNSRFYADDDLIVGSADPFQLFRIMVEIVSVGAHRPESRVNFMLDQCHNIEEKIPGQIHSVLNVEKALAKALLVDTEALTRGAAGRRRAGRARGADGRVRDRRPRRPRRPARGTRACRATRSRRSPPPDTPRRPRRRGSAAPRPVGEREMTTSTGSTVDDLVARSNRLGADRRNTNYAGGNTSAKGTDVDPVTGRAGGPVVGQGIRRRPRHADRPPGWPCCGSTGCARWSTSTPAWTARTRWSPRSTTACSARGGAAPSIDTAMHGLVDAPHVDHLHPDAGIAIATAADGEALTKEIFGDRVVWVPWRRPGFQLGLDIAAVKRANPRAIGVILGGHGITAWGATSDECEANSLEIIRAAQEFIDRRGAAEPFGAEVPGFAPLPTAERHARAAALLPVVRGLASTDRPQVGHYTDSDVVLDFLSRAKLGPLAALGTSCPDHFLRTKVRPLVLDLPPTASAGRDRRPAARAARRLPRRVPGVLRAARHRGLAADARRRPGDRAGARRRACSRSGPTSRPRGSPASSTSTPSTSCAARRRSPSYAPIDEAEKFRIEYWALEEAKLRRMPTPKPLASRVAFVTGGGSGIGRAIAHRLAAEGACVVVADRDADTAAKVAAEIGTADTAVAVTADVTDADAVAAALRAAVLAFGGVDLVVNNAGLSISKPLLETTEADWDLQHDVMAKGSFLVSREAARIMIAQGMGGDIVYISSKNSLFAGPNNVAYGAAKADQAHQVRLLAAELGEHGIRVNGVNPDGVVRGSGIFAGGWGAKRAAVYGVPEERARRVLRPAHAAQARGAARARGQRGVRADRRGAVAHDRAARAGRRRRRGGVPAMSTSRSPPSTSARPAAG